MTDTPKTYLDPVICAGDGKQMTVHGSWYRGEHCNFHVAKKHRADPLYYDKYVLHGWTPEAPFIKKSDCITSFGSCFAAHVTHHLKERGYTVGDIADTSGQTHVVRFGEGMVNVFSILEQLYWGFGEGELDHALWFNSEAELVSDAESIRQSTQELFQKTSVWILTLGLGEVWYNRETGSVSWRAIPKSVFDPRIHGFRTLTFLETALALKQICSLILEHRPESSIILTLSPVPLVTTFRPISCITANAASKAVLRAAIDEYMQIKPFPRGIYYFPAYEIVQATHDPYEEDNRHPKLAVIQTIMRLFEKYYCIP